MRAAVVEPAKGVFEKNYFCTGNWQAEGAHINFIFLCRRRRRGRGLLLLLLRYGHRHALRRRRRRPLAVALEKQHVEDVRLVDEQGFLRSQLRDLQGQDRLSLAEPELLALLLLALVLRRI